MKVIKNLAYNSGTKTDPHWVKCGIILQREDGSMAVKIDVIPVSFEGWFSAFDIDEGKPGNESREKKEGDNLGDIPPELLKKLLLERLQNL